MDKDVKGANTKEQRALIERINDLKLSDGEKKELNVYYYF